LGANGNPEIHTPVLDTLASEGINFDHCFVQNPVCMPSRISLLSGQYPATLGMMRNGVPVPRQVETLPAMLRNYGYTSANIGKLHFLPHANRDHTETHPDYGFDHLEISDEPGCYEDAYRAWVRREAPDQLDRISVGLPPAAYDWQRTMGIDDPIRHPMAGRRVDVGGAIPFAGHEARTHTAFVADQTIEFLQQQGNHPFFCIAGFYSPHSPWVVPQRFLDLYDPQELTLPVFPEELEARRAADEFSDAALRSARHGYYAMVSEVDFHAGRILDCLDELGKREETIVVFTSDHGEWLGEHLRYGKGYPGHDCVTRVPLLLRLPHGSPNRGRTVASIVEAVDLLPTLLALAGMPIPPQVQGVSLVPVIDGDVRAIRESALTEMTGWKALRTSRFRYIAHADGAESLFDLAQDRDAYRDVAGHRDYEPALVGLRHEMIKRLITRERPLPRTWAY
jgi:arylsulfatase A-like enzyme